MAKNVHISLDENIQSLTLYLFKNNDTHKCMQF